MNQTTARLYCKVDDFAGPYQTSYDPLPAVTLTDLVDYVAQEPRQLINFYQTAYFMGDVFCWLRYTYFSHCLLASGVHVPDDQILKPQLITLQPQLRFNGYLLNKLVFPYAAYVRKLANCHEMYKMLVGKESQETTEQHLFMLPAINLLSAALKMIDFITSIERITKEVYPFIQQIERQLSQDVISIQGKIEELHVEHQTGTHAIVGELVGSLRDSVFANSFRSSTLHECMQTTYYRKKSDDIQTATHECVEYSEGHSTSSDS